MKDFIYKLLAKDETGVDAVAFMAVVSLLTLIVLTAIPAIYAAIVEHRVFDGTGFATAALMIIGCGAGGKMIRDNKFTNHPPDAPPA